MAKIQLIFSEAYVKGLLPLSDNVAGAFMRSAMFEAQEIGLKQILGTCLLEKCKAVAAKEVLTPADQPYVDLIAQAQNYLAYMTIKEVIVKVAYKVGNIGAVRSRDEYVDSIGEDKIDGLQDDYQAKADFFAGELQRWILANAGDFPELDACSCDAIRANLKSSASCTIFLGGPRGYADNDTDIFDL